MKIITYATHSHGMFDDLVNNKFGIKIEVLGWGEKWNGFNDKIKKTHEYINNLSDDDIIIVVDGFDSKIIKSLDEIEKRFLEMKCQVLFSEDKNSFLQKTRFSSCSNNNTLNAGLYMGYVKQLKQILNDANNMNCKDDQRNLNMLCKKYPFIKIDVDEIVFSNKNNNNACILGFPGTPSINRFIRGLKEYAQFFIINLIILFLVVIVMFPNKYVISLFIILMTLYIYKADDSCLTQIK